MQRDGNILFTELNIISRIYFYLIDTLKIKVKMNILGKYMLIIFIILLYACNRETDHQELRLAYVMATGGTSDKAAEKFKELIEQNTKKKIHVRIYPNGVLGNDRILVEGLQLGSQDMIIIGASVIGWIAPEYGLIEAPFLFRNYEHLDKVLSGDIGKEIEEKVFKKSKLRFLGYMHRGPRYLTTTSRIVHEPEDLHGLKLRVPELPVYIKSWKIFGANPTPIPYSDMFMALKQGVVDGQENPLEVIYTSHLYETQRYIMKTKHLIGFYIVVVSARFYKKYSEENRRVIQKAVRESIVYQNDIVDRYERLYKKKLEDYGVKFIDVDRSSFEKLAKQKLPLAFKNVWAPGIFERISNVK